ncbi:hypothetical protein JYT44_01700 [Caldithrix abyssi]|nr:hypothetical protein [Caldithrix abyssi]
MKDETKKLLERTFYFGVNRLVFLDKIPKNENDIYQGTLSFLLEESIELKSMFTTIRINSQK